MIARSEEEAQRKADERFPGQTFTLKQDEDVLDTWFSSGLWPFSTLGWPEKVLRSFHRGPVLTVCTDSRLRAILPGVAPRDGLGYLALLGLPNDDVGHPADWQSTLSRSLLPRNDS